MPILPFPWQPTCSSLWDFTFHHPVPTLPISLSLSLSATPLYNLPALHKQLTNGYSSEISLTTSPSRHLSILSVGLGTYVHINIKSIEFPWCFTSVCCWIYLWWWRNAEIKSDPCCYSWLLSIEFYWVSQGNELSVKRYRYESSYLLLKCYSIMELCSPILFLFGSLVFNQVIWIGFLMRLADLEGSEI